MRSARFEVPVSALDLARWEGASFLARGVALFLLLGLLSLVVVPWQQSVYGSGRVIAYAPLERQQTVEAPIEGRVTHWYVQEGMRVEAGAPIADLADNDPDILARIMREESSARAQVDAVSLSIALEESRILSLGAAYESDLIHARFKLTMAQERVDAATRAQEAAQSALRTAQLNVERQRQLFAKGLASKRELEVAELEFDTATAGLARAESALRAANAGAKGFAAEREKTASQNQASLNAAKSSLEKLRGDKAKAEAEVAKVEVRLARQQQMQVVAPRAGVILRLVAHQGSEMVKAGDPLVTLVPDVDANAVELTIDGNDASLLAEGRRVRLYFEGWPALQFVGWPSVAVGTFGGEVAFIDAHADSSGKFRVVVVPDKNDAPWPETRYLRQGVRAGGFILLDQVPLGFELWRNFNGFPPAVSNSQGSATTGEKSK